VAVGVLGSVVAYWLNVSRDPLGLYPIRDAALGQMVDNIVTLAVIFAGAFYAILVPVPASTIWVSPWGVRVEQGNRALDFPWSEVHCVGPLLFAFPPKARSPGRWKMTADQSDRVHVYRTWARAQGATAL